MAKTWIEVLADKGAEWNVPTAEKAALAGLADAAEEALAAAVASRSPVTTAACQAAFDALEAKMRFIKDRYFKVPPLTAADLRSLLLHEKKEPAPVGKPSAQATATTIPAGPGRILLKIQFISDVLYDAAAANYGVSVFARVLSAGEPIPTAIEGFERLRFVRRKNEVVVRPESERGMRICFYFVVEAPSGDQGDPGPIIWTIIP
jgi:hypothetical protein